MARVLVVDDSLSVRKMMERALESKGFEILAASSGAEAMERFGSGTPDLVVCDVVMPDVDGSRFCEFVRAHPTLGATPVLLISGIVNATVLERASNVHSSDVLRKPFTAEELARKVDQLLSDRAQPPAPAPPPPVPAPPRVPTRAPAPAAIPIAAPAEIVEIADVKATLGKLAAMPGVSLAVLTDRDGFLIETAGEIGVGAEAAAALAGCLAESSEGIGRDLGQGALQSIILDYESGMLLLYGVGSGAMLAVVLNDATALGKVRYSIKKVLPELQRSL
jgi:CheY-like chemotaxis protein/predicted regulator of Ras-like GTPase activity (Roadblock/LC7/MglB family)